MTQTLCRFGFLLNPYHDYAIKTKGFPSAHRDQKIKLRRLLSSYFFTFKEDDPVVLRLASMESTDWTEIRYWIEEAKQNNHFASYPRIEIDENIVTESMAVDFQKSCGIFLNTVSIRPPDLYHLFLKQIQNQTNNVYEMAEVTDAYDFNFVRSVRKQIPSYQGSTFLGKLGPRLSQIFESPDPIHSLLDIGCGAGSFYELCRKYARTKGYVMPHYLGLDYSRSQVFRAQENYPTGLFVPGDAHRLPFPDSSFDAVIATSVLGFTPQPIQALQELARVSKHLMLTSISSYNPEDPFSPPSHLMTKNLNRISSPIYYSHEKEVDRLLDSIHERCRYRKELQIVAHAEDETQNLVHLTASDASFPMIAQAFEKKDTSPIYVQDGKQSFRIYRSYLYFTTGRMGALEDFESFSEIYNLMENYPETCLSR